jgi:hypothetical protein
MTQSDKIPTKRKLTLKQTAMVGALIKALGNVTTACREVDVSRETHYQWLKKNAIYKAKVEEVPEIEVDFYENALRKRVNEGDTTAIIFALKAKGRSRGWIDRHEVDAAVVTQAVTHEDVKRAIQELVK